MPKRTCNVSHKTIISKTKSKRLIWVKTWKKLAAVAVVTWVKTPMIKYQVHFKLAKTP